MKKTEFRTALRNLIAGDVIGVDTGEKLSIGQLINRYEVDTSADESRKGEPWTTTSCALRPRVQAWLWQHLSKSSVGAAEDRADVQRKRPDDKFFAQVNRIAREVGWRATKNALW